MANMIIPTNTKVLLHNTMALEMDKSPRIQQYPTKEPQTSTDFKIYLNAYGRLGNNIFQVIAAIAIALQANRTIVMHPALYDIFKTNFVFDTSDLSIIPAFKPSYHIKYMREKRSFNYEPERYFNLPPEDVWICCAFQTWKYFAHMQNRVKLFLTCNEDLRKNATDFLSSVRHGRNITLISAHVRRTDILDDKIAGRFKMNVPSIDYVMKAMNHYRDMYSKVHFVVCSDDIEWCKDQLSSFTDVSFSEGHSRYEDICILAHCDHSILTHGTFGWWGAWLAGGDVVYYDKNYNDEAKLQAELENFFLPEWIPMH